MSSDAAPAWKSKSKFQPKPVNGWLAGAGLIVGVIVIWSPTNTVAPLAIGTPAWFTAVIDATAGAFWETQDIGITKADTPVGR